MGVIYVLLVLVPFNASQLLLTTNLNIKITGKFEYYSKTDNSQFCAKTPSEVL